MNKVAVIDIGSNSIKLLVMSEDGPVAKELKGIRISEGISQKEPKLTEESIEKGVSAVQELVEITKEHELSITLIVGTSALREASNSDVFCEKVKKLTGHSVYILTGEQEATYIAQGIVLDEKLTERENFCLFDLGGGSLECIEFENGKVRLVRSLPLGAVRLTEQFVESPDMPVRKETLESIKQHVLQMIPESFPVKKWPLVGMGGGLSVANKLFETDRELEYEHLLALRGQLASMTLSERLKNPHIPKFRGDVIPTALTVVLTLMEKAQVSKILFSPYNLRYGLSKALLAHGSDVISEILRQGNP